MHAMLQHVLLYRPFLEVLYNFNGCLFYSSEHQELVKQIQDTRKTEVREDLERELDCLVKRMEVKGDQICKLKKHQAAVSC